MGWHVAACRLETDAYSGDMTASEVIQQLQALPPQEVAKVRDWLIEHDDESPELLAAIDEGLRSLEKKGARDVTRTELENKVRQWAGKSR
jgi:hypothetical protein